ncbi:LysR family transcriptional regulator [Motiliproteus sp. MSK22-1]|uniref:LysR family transcriptional regulator n=1 Tax=Motiliproteus sp. MSK22-1 TaxID=1897630 RepID=UPI000976F20B|nr:LysR family transcriptional regulator [Motiliproteus sp. MSK22-1]OMH38043.1 LysR family transcriptional regulator [Motiliproteus sp. MSK22-1]
MLDDIALFVHIAQHRGLSATAEMLKVPAATVTRRLQKLETTLGCRLIHRSARKFELTAEGDAYYQAYAGLVKQFEETARDLSSDVHQLHGKLKVMAPTNISIGLLQPMWSAFIGAYPDIQLELMLNNQVEDLLSSQVDIALRIGPQIDSQLYQKRLGSVATILLAAPDYLEQQGRPEVLEDLNHHRLITVSNLPVWKLQKIKTKASATVNPIAATSVNDIRLASQLARDGLGISLLPVSEVKEELQQGRLEQVLAPWCGPERDILAVWPSGRLLSAKARCLRDFMQQHIQKESILQGRMMVI